MHAGSPVDQIQSTDAPLEEGDSDVASVPEEPSRTATNYTQRGPFWKKVRNTEEQQRIWCEKDNTFWDVDAIAAHLKNMQLQYRSVKNRWWTQKGIHCHLLWTSWDQQWCCKERSNEQADSVLFFINFLKAFVLQVWCSGTYHNRPPTNRHPLYNGHWCGTNWNYYRTSV